MREHLIKCSIRFICCRCQNCLYIHWIPYVEMCVRWNLYSWSQSHFIHLKQFNRVEITSGSSLRLMHFDWCNQPKRNFAKIWVHTMPKKGKKNKKSRDSHLEIEKFQHWRLTLKVQRESVQKEIFAGMRVQYIFKMATDCEDLKIFSTKTRLNRWVQWIGARFGLAFADSKLCPPHTITTQTILYIISTLWCVCESVTIIIK